MPTDEFESRKEFEALITDYMITTDRCGQHAPQTRAEFRINARALLTKYGAALQEKLAQSTGVIAKAHLILDGMGIKSAMRAECNDPDCDSQLVHRLKEVGEKLDQAQAERATKNGFAVQMLEYCAKHSIGKTGDKIHVSIMNECDRLRSQLEEANLAIQAESKRAEGFAEVCFSVSDQLGIPAYHGRMRKKLTERINELVAAEAANQRLVEALQDILADQSIDWIMGGRIRQIAEKALKVERALHPTPSPTPQNDDMGCTCYSSGVDDDCPKHAPHPAKEGT